MSNGNRNQRNRGNQQRRSGSGGGGNRNRGRQQSAPKGPAMTALGESTYEAVFDHGNEGYGVWFDGVVREDPMYRQHWKGLGLRPIYVKIEEDRIVISRDIDRPRPAGPNFDADSLNDDDMNVDISLGDLTGDHTDSDASADDDSSAASTETVYSPEEAARLFVSEGESSAAPAEAEVEEAPAPKRRTTRRTTATKRRTTAASDEAAKDSDAEEA